MILNSKLVFKLCLNVLLPLLLLLSFSGCKNPLEGFYKYIQNDGFLPYRLPLQKAGPGTLIAGTPDNSLVMPPSGSSKCFPKVEDGIASGLIIEDPTAIPSITNSIDLKTYADFSLAQEGFDISAGAEFSLAKSVSMYAINPVIVSFDYSALREHFSTLSDECKVDLKNKHLVIEALKVDRLHFIFKDAKGSSFYAKLVLEKLIKVGAGYDLSIKNEVELAINSPMFIGLKLGKLDDQGRIVAFANSVKNKQWKYVSIARGETAKEKVFDIDNDSNNNESNIDEQAQVNNAYPEFDTNKTGGITEDIAEDKADGIVGAISLRVREEIKE